MARLKPLFAGRSDAAHALQIQLAEAVERRCGGKAHLDHQAEVRVEFSDKRVWVGIVHVFELRGHPTAWGAYAWPAAARGGEAPEIHVVLRLPTIGSAEQAVRSVMRRNGSS